MTSAIVRSLLLTTLASGLTLKAQEVLWNISQPSAGPFWDMLVVIGDRDGDTYDDFIVPVAVPISSGGSATTPELWFFSGQDGHVLGKGQRSFGYVAAAGDWDRDGCVDYVLTVVGGQLPLCWPYPCIRVEVRSGRTSALLMSHDVYPHPDFGHILRGNIDLNGDGLPDVVAGTNYAIGPGNIIGSVVIGIANDGTELFSAWNAPGEVYAPGIDKFVDWNGDGRQDFLLGVYEPTGRGAVDIRSGLDGSVLQRVYGVPPILFAHGATAAMIGDQDGDGLPDIVSGDSAIGSPGVLEVLSSATGAQIHRWQVNTQGGDDFGWPDVVCMDVDRDGIDDLIANSRAQQNRGTYMFSGRDGSVIQHIPATNTWGIVGRVQAMPPRAGELFRRFVARGAVTLTTGATFMVSCAPGGVAGSGPGSTGSLARAPRIGVRQFDPTGFRITLSNAEPGAPSLLVIGFAQPPVPVIDMQLLGFLGCTLWPAPDAYAFSLAGSNGLQTGYSAHDFGLDLVSSPLPGPAWTVFAQWVTLGAGPTWPGGVSEAVRMYVR